MSRSSNPVLSRQDVFTPAAPQQGQQAPGATSPTAISSIRVRLRSRPRRPDDLRRRGHQDRGHDGHSGFDRAAAWFTVPDALMFPAMILLALVGFGVVLVVAFRRVINPALVLVYAAIEGVFIGMISKYFEYLYSGIVAQAVLGTFAAAGVTLAAYKFFNIRVTPKFTKIVIIATISFAVAMPLNFVLALAGFNVGLRDGGTGPAVCWPSASPCSARHSPC